MNRDVTALIVAAGSGARLGAGVPKALVPLAGRSLFTWSVDLCTRADSIGPVVLVAPPSHLESFAGDGFSVTPGGSSRSGSVACGLGLVETDLVLIHDAARPLASPALVDRAVGALKANAGLDAVVTAIPVNDTVKRVDAGGRVTATLDRSALRRAQTPQVFRTAVLRRAIAAGDPAGATDDAALVEAAGGAVGTIEGEPGNIKITVKEDLELAAFLLRNTR